MGERRGVYRVMVGKLEGKRLLGRPRRRSIILRCIDGRIILRCIFRKWDVGYGEDPAGSGEGQVVGTCECGIEPSGSIKRGEFLD
jgi:hypothetical protein